MRVGAALIASATLAACVPNPRNEIPAVLAGAVPALTAAKCVERELLRFDANIVSDAPPGFADLLASRFRGGGGVKGASVAGLAIRHHPTCHQLYGPVIAGDHALVRAAIGDRHQDVWLRRIDTRWAVVPPEGASG